MDFGSAFWSLPPKRSYDRIGRLIELTPADIGSQFLRLVLKCGLERWVQHAHAVHAVCM